MRFESVDGLPQIMYNNTQWIEKKKLKHRSWSIRGVLLFYISNWKKTKWAGEREYRTTERVKDPLNNVWLMLIDNNWLLIVVHVNCFWCCLFRHSTCGRAISSRLSVAQNQMFIFNIECKCASDKKMPNTQFTMQICAVAWLQSFFFCFFFESTYFGIANALQYVHFSYVPIIVFFFVHRLWKSV